MSAGGRTLPQDRSAAQDAMRAHEQPITADQPVRQPGSIPDRTNRFAFKIATVNGTGSASANALLRQAIFRMGIPVSGKNLFPSNIQGLPTWYEIRVDADGHTARTPRFDLIVAMNAATYARDIAEVVPGGWVLYDASRPLDGALQRADIEFIGIPFAQLCAERFTGVRARILMKNIAYVGALAALLDVDLDIVRNLLTETYARKQALLDSNQAAIEIGYEQARASVACPLPIRLAPMDATRDHVLVDGNTAAALGCVYAGATVAAWYPITPSTSLLDAFDAFCAQHRVDPQSGQRRVAILQAEDELAAAGMVLGAAWNGARAFTATSGPGISLMGEFIGLAYYAEIPGVFFDIQRVGPSTGMPTRTQQGDLLSVVYASHGDTKHIALFPADPHECFHHAVAAFDLAERFQTPVFVVSDLDIGMNDWDVPRIAWDDAYRPDRGKVLDAAALAHVEKFHRYLDVDGDGVPYRTLPGQSPKGAYFTRGSGHDRYGRYTEDPPAYADVMERIARKIENAAAHVPPPELIAAPDPVRTNGARSSATAERATAKDAAAAQHGGNTAMATASHIGIIAVGSSRRAVIEAQARLAALGIAADFLRPRAFPFPATVSEFVRAHDISFVVDQNRDAQLHHLLVMEAHAPRAKLRSITHFGGYPLSADAVVDGVLADLNPVTDGGREVSS